jgi:hypothetical protein
MKRTATSDLFESTSPYAGFELTALEVTDTDCTGRIICLVMETKLLNGVKVGIQLTIKFFGDSRQVGGFLVVLRFPPRIILTAVI